MNVPWNLTYPSLKNATMSMAEAIVIVYGQFNAWLFYLLILTISLAYSRLVEIPVR